MAKKYVFLDAYEYPDSDFHQEYEVFSKTGYQCEVGNCRTADDVVKFAGDAEVIGDCYVPITAELLDRLPELRAVIRYGVGYDCVDVEACTKRKIMVCNLPHYCMEDVATHAMAMMLDLERKVTFLDRDCRKGNWNIALGYDSHRLSNLTLGLVGFGNIARTLKKYAQVFRMRVIAYDPYLKEELFVKEQVKKVTLEELYREADVLSLHLPATPETQHLIDKEALAAMKKSAMLINTSRGSIIDQQALLEALKNKVIQAAALDVFEKEPIRSANDVLYSCDNLIVTPHAAYNSVEASDEQHRTAAETAVVVLNGKIPENTVNQRQLGF